MQSYLTSLKVGSPAYPGVVDPDDTFFHGLIKTEFSQTRYEPYTLVLEKGHKIPLIGYIRSGSLDLLASAPGGQALRKGVLGKGEFFGLELFFDQGLSLYDAFSLDYLDCYVIDPERLLELMAAEPEFRLHLEGLLLENMKRFFRGPVFSGVTSIPETHKITRFDKCVAYIDSHYMNPLTLDDVARKAGLSRYYFSRMFKKETGHSFKDYLNITRMEAAKKILGLPEMNISQACYSVGFNDVSYFARIFKRYEGVSPSTFRKRMMSRV